MIYVGFSSPKKWMIGAEAIKWWTKKPYSHVFIRFESSNPKIPSNVYHAAHGMVHFISFENFSKNNNTVKEYGIEIGPEDRIDILAHCMKLSGDPYSTAELVQIFICDVLDSLKIKTSSKDKNGYICSELVGTILSEKWGYEFKIAKHMLKPNHIDEALEGFTATVPAAPQPILTKS